MQSQRTHKESAATQFKPMLAAEADLNKLRFPLIASPKLDGVRAIIKGGVVLSRSLKPIPNPHVQALFGRPELEGLDGELIVGSPTAKDVYRVTNGAVMRHYGEPDVEFYVFDRVEYGHTYEDRHAELYMRLEERGWYPHVIYHDWQTVEDLEELLEFENSVLDDGYEGVILRCPYAGYKHGRSTVRQQGMLKLKRFQDSEARVIAVEELMHNANEAKTNALGRTERSSHKANQVPMGTMGALLVEDIHTGVRFHIGTGFSAEERAWFWEHRHTLERGKRTLVKYKFFPVGVKDLPRHPSYLGLRDQMDL